MKKIEINLYEFNELNEKAKEYAIEHFREIKYDDCFVSRNAIDNCYLFEPNNMELEKLFGIEYTKLNTPILGNTRKNIYFDTERNRHIDASSGIVVNNEKMFLKWLGIDYELQEKICFNITKTQNRYSDTIIEFEHINELSSEEIEILDNACEKFSDHMENVLNDILHCIEYQYSDECIIEDILINDYFYTENGELY